MKKIPTQHKQMILAFEIVILIGLLLPPSLFHSFGCTATSAIRTNYHSANGYFIDNQVIVIGTADDFQNVIDPMGLIQIEGCDLSYLESRDFKRFWGVPIYPKAGQISSLFVRSALAANQQDSLLMRLYEIPEGKSVEGVLKDINNIAGHPNLSADPNYLTRLSDSTIDPCIRTGDSGSGGGHPFGDPGMPFFDETNERYDATKAEEAFKNQWAFGNQGISLPSSMDLKGRRVNVGVFDTSPFRPREYLYKHVELAFPPPFWIKSRDAVGTPMISNHGLFVAGLIHRIAPRSKVQLIRVLDDGGCGDLWALNKALEDYTSRMSTWTGRLDKTVINLSLGIRPKDQEDSETEEKLETLKSTLTKAYQLGAIIVAAAGNDIPEDPDNPVTMQIPAKYDSVIGVAATSMDGERACYSNKGNVAAPGGGNPFNSAEPCEPRTSNWDIGLSPCSANDMANCPYGLISLAQTQYGQQYIFWSGTSFSTPLVSGLAALSFEKVGKNTRQVECLIFRQPPPRQLNDDFYAGIIDIAESFNNSDSILSACDADARP